MNAMYFDSLVRSLAVASSRRAAWRLLTITPLGAALGSLLILFVRSI